MAWKPSQSKRGIEEGDTTELLRWGGPHGCTVLAGFWLRQCWVGVVAGFWLLVGRCWLLAVGLWLWAAGC